WQKLWVVFTSFCLYFYKSYQDEFALASLPLLGYTVGPPGVQDALQKDFVFKLSFKNHVYFFRAESEHTYNRWLEATRFQQLYREFEQQKVCYVPVGYLLLKPFHRLLHYQLLLDRLLDHYGEDHFDRTDCHGALMMLGRTTDTINSLLPESENYVLLCELQRDLVGFDQLVQPGRRLIRQGCLLKHSKRGLQQRMFFLFSDVLLYASKSPVNQTFKVLGHVPLRSLLTENAEHNAFVIFGGQRAITVSAGTTAEKTLWLAELAKASSDAKTRPHVQLAMGSLKNCSSSEEGLETCGLNAGAVVPGKTPPSRKLAPDDVESLQPLFQLMEAMIQHHGVFLRDLEHRLVLWEGRGSHETHRIGDIMLKNMVVLLRTSKSRLYVRSVISNSLARKYALSVGHRFLRASPPS
uniref:DH domain-containing protein n=1 Tax=Phlebotomus papatasi TaxID=29031 RepID=A0A1B0DHU2_PHLPP